MKLQPEKDTILQEQQVRKAAYSSKEKAMITDEKKQKQDDLDTEYMEDEQKQRPMKVSKKRSAKRSL